MPKPISSRAAAKPPLALKILKSALSVLSVFKRRPADSLALVVAFAIMGAIVVNAVALQAGPHPAPIAKPMVAAAVAEPQPAKITTGSLVGSAPTTAMPSAAPAPAPTAEPVKRTRAQIVADIQKALTRRGYYDGPIDGVFGPKMEAAIRQFEQTARLRVSGEATETLLKVLLRSPAKAKAANVPPGNGRKILAVQRALSDYGYGPVPPTGTFGEATKAAVEKFERDRKLPISGQLTPRVMRELAQVTGRSFE